MTDNRFEFPFKLIGEANHVERVPKSWFHSLGAQNEDFGPVSRTYLTRSLVPSLAKARNLLVNVIFTANIHGRLMEI